MSALHTLARCGVAAAAVILVTAARLPAHPVSDSARMVRVSRDVLPPAPWADDDPADSLYRVARQAVNDNDFRKAARLFQEITDKHPSSAYAAEALYWRAFSLYKLGGEANFREALKALDTEKSRYPKAKAISDVDPLAVRIRGALAQLGDAGSAESLSAAARTTGNCTRGGQGDDVRSEALNALLQMDAQNAVPILKEVLQKRDACSVWMRKKAVFLLSQKNNGESENLMIDAIRNDPSAEVRADAVFWLGQVHSDRAETMLVDIAMNGKDTELRKKAVFALTQQGMPRGQALIRKLADDPATPAEVRKDAIWQLGQQASPGNADALKAIFGHAKNDEVAKSVLFSLSQMRGFGNDRWLLSVAMDHGQSDEVRKHAIFCAGQAGVSAAELISMYEKIPERPIKEQIIWVLSDSQDRTATDKLIDIAKNDHDVEMRKKALFWLGQKNDPRVRQLLIDIIKGE